MHQILKKGHTVPVCYIKLWMILSSLQQWDQQTNLSSGALRCGFPGWWQTLAHQCQTSLLRLWRGPATTETQHTFNPKRKENQLSQTAMTRLKPTPHYSLQRPFTSARGRQQGTMPASKHTNTKGPHSVGFSSSPQTCDSYTLKQKHTKTSLIMKSRIICWSDLSITFDTLLMDIPLLVRLKRR